MGYIRSNQDWYEANGDFRTPSQRASDMEKDIREDKHMPDSVREKLEQEIKNNKKG